MSFLAASAALAPAAYLAHRYTGVRAAVTVRNMALTLFGVTGALGLIGLGEPTEKQQPGEEASRGNADFKTNVGPASPVCRVALGAAQAPAQQTEADGNLRDRSEYSPGEPIPGWSLVERKDGRTSARGQGEIRNFRHIASPAVSTTAGMAEGGRESISPARGLA